MAEQPVVDSPTPEQRLANLFAAPEVVPTETAEPVQAQETQEETQEDTPQDAEEQPAEDEGEEFEVDGETYKLPSTLKAKVQEWRDGSLRQSDYTRKTQELAELHKQVAAIAEAANARQQFEASISDERRELERVQSQLEQYKAVDWNSIDAEVAQRLFFQREQLKEQAKDLESKIGQKGEQFKQWTERKRREVIAQGQKYLQQSIKGWGKEAMADVSKAASDVGYTNEELESVFDPRFVRLAHKAAQYDKLLAGKEAAVSAVKKAPPVVKPGAGQGQKVAAEQKFNDLRKAQRRSGSVTDTARLLLQGGYIK